MYYDYIFDILILTIRLEQIMEHIFKAILGFLTVVFVLTFFLAAAFAPFGIVWLVITH